MDKNMRHLTQKHGRRYIDLMSDMENEVRLLEDEELRRLESTVRGFGQTNCGWQEYQMKDMWLKVVRRETYVREQKRKQEPQSV